MEFGLIGKKLNYSCSPLIHSLISDYRYELAEMDDISKFMTVKDFNGINVTMPYKKEAYTFCDEVSETARRIGCVNTVVRRSDGTLYGENTDYFGFLWMLEKAGIDPKGRTALVLGSGGASKMAQIALKDAGAIRVEEVSRSGPLNYGNVYSREMTEIIINATPVGMYPSNGDKLLNLYRFPVLCGVADVIYNPCKSALVLEAEKNYIRSTGGLSMLVAQAVKSAELFLDSSFSDEFIESIYKECAYRFKNILIIGMPGCGKTSVSARLSELTGREVIDLDTEIESRTGRRCSEIITCDGEAAFREIETSVLKEVSILSGKIISCGGGIISPKKNRFIMRQNSNVVWIQRDLDLLETSGRPLSEIIGTHELYRFREPLYIESADYTVTNNGTVDECAKKIIEVLKN